jgi:hypothetical protein
MKTSISSFRHLIFALVAAFALTTAVPDLAEAKGSRSRSSFGSSSRSKPSSSWGSKRKATPRKAVKPKASSGWGSSSKKKATATTSSSKPKKTGLTSKDKSGRKGTTYQAKTKSGKPISKTDMAAHKKAKEKGTAFKSKKAAMTDYKAKNKGKFPAKYDKKPATRPSHIPQTTMVGGRNTTVVFNQGYGGYGYMMAGAWVMYDPYPYMARRHGYYWGPQPVAVVHTSFTWLWILLSVVVIAVIFGIFISRRD